MADRGLEIKDLLSRKGTTLNIHPFLGQRKQLTATEVEETQFQPKCSGMSDIVKLACMSEWAFNQIQLGCDGQVEQSHASGSKLS